MSKSIKNFKKMNRSLMVAIFIVSFIMSNMTFSIPVNAATTTVKKLSVKTTGTTLREGQKLTLADAYGEVYFWMLPLEKSWLVFPRKNI